MSRGHVKFGNEKTAMTQSNVGNIKKSPRVESHYTAPGCWAITRTYARPGGARVCAYYVWLSRRHEYTLLYVYFNDTLYAGMRKRTGAEPMYV